MPTVLRKYGYRFHFYSNEGNESPHIHVTGHGGEMKIWIPSMQVASSYQIQPADQRKILEVVKENLILIQEKWNEFASRKK